MKLCRHQFWFDGRKYPFPPPPFSLLPHFQNFRNHSFFFIWQYIMNNTCILCPQFFDWYCISISISRKTRWPRCATFYIEISYFFFITLSCQILFAMNKFIWYFGLVLHYSISCVKHVDFYFTFYDKNATKLWTKMQPKAYLFIHQNIFLLLKCIEIDLGKINYYLSNPNLESKKYLVNSEFV